MRVLLVGDDESTAKVVANSLTQQNYAVDVATDDHLGWQFVETIEYSLILLDVVLPKLDGVNFCRRLRQEHHQMPVLLLTAQNTTAEKVTGLDAGADDYVVKPFELEELMARIRALLRRRSSFLPPVLQWGSLRLDPSVCQVTYDGKPLSLTPKEYSLLKFFLHNCDRILSRGTILDHLWTFENPPEEDTIKSHIKSLRRKFKSVKANADPIETVYGLGYRLKPSSKEKNQTTPATNLEESWKRQQVMTAVTQVCQCHSDDACLPTKSMNQGETLRALEQSLYLANRHGQPLYLVVLKLDDLRQIRYQHGDAAEDAVMWQLKQFLQQMFRSTDIVARWNDGTCVIGLYGMTKVDGVRRLREIFKLLHQTNFVDSKGIKLQVTFRVGTAGYPDDGTDWQTLYQAACATLFHSGNQKHLGSTRGNKELGDSYSCLG